jgi:hypothetical protein
MANGKWRYAIGDMRYANGEWRMAKKQMKRGIASSIK